MFDAAERRYLETAPLGRLATADDRGRPHAVPVCYALVDDGIVSPIDEKPKAVPPGDLRRVRDVRSNPAVALVVDHYTTDWSALGWVQVRGTASYREPEASGGHDRHATALERKYDQYGSHDLADRPLIHIDPGEVRSWGRLERPGRDG